MDNEQKMYDTVMLAAHRNIFGEKDDDTRFKMVLQRLEGGEDLAESVAGIAGVTLSNIQASAEKANREIPKQIVLEAADELVDRLLDIAEAAKLIEGDREAVKKKALFSTMRAVGQQELKTMTPEKKARAEAEMQRIRQKPKVEDTKSGVIGSRMKEAV